jgi:hypothetical protein
MFHTHRAIVTLLRTPASTIVLWGLFLIFLPQSNKSRLVILCCLWREHSEARVECASQLMLLTPKNNYVYSQFI